MPPELGEPERLVIVYGEIFAPEAAAATESARERDIVQLAAERVASVERLSVVARPHAEKLLEHVRACAGLPVATLVAGCSPAELAAAWQAFVRPDDVVIAWNQSTFTRLEAASLSLPPGRLSLKAVYCDRHQHQGSPGHLEEAVAAHGLPLPPPAFPGRAGHRMACARAMLEYLAGLAVPR